MTDPVSAVTAEETISAVANSQQATKGKWPIITKILIGIFILNFVIQNSVILLNMNFDNNPYSHIFNIWSSKDVRRVKESRQTQDDMEMAHIIADVHIQEWSSIDDISRDDSDKIHKLSLDNNDALHNYLQFQDREMTHLLSVTYNFTLGRLYMVRGDVLRDPSALYKAMDYLNAALVNADLVMQDKLITDEQKRYFYNKKFRYRISRSMANSQALLAFQSGKEGDREEARRLLSEDLNGCTLLEKEKYTYSKIYLGTGCPLPRVKKAGEV